MSLLYKILTPYTNKPSEMTTTYQLVLTTCPDRDSAERIARTLVERRLAACVNIVPGVQSYYEWKGKIETGQEFLLVIKSRAELFETLQKQIVSAHPYELPEIIAVPVSTGSAPYLAWLEAQTRPLHDANK